MSSDSIKLGDVEITRVVEIGGAFGTGQGVIPGSGRRIWRDNQSWLAPDFWSAADDGYLAHIQTWVVRSEGRTILVDTGVGDDRDRPQVPRFAGLRTGFLDRLRAAGVRPEDVDVVINTHVHYDHVGWNTRRHDGEWVPTFPHATYLIPRRDNDYFDPAGPGKGRPPRDEAEALRWRGAELVFADSVAPIHRAGQAVLWDDTYRVDGNLTLRAAPGHTPGSSVLYLSSGDDRAVFVGDLLHSPVQILRAELNSCFCDDPVRAAATRARVLSHAADTTTLVVPAHFPGHGAVEVRREGQGFAVAGWAPFSRGGVALP